MAERRIRISLTAEDESWDYELPEQGPELMAKFIELITGLEESRISSYGAYGPGIDIRRIPVKHPTYAFQTAFVETAESQESEFDGGEIHAVDCCCIFCIPGA